MNKQELVALVAENSEQTQKAVDATLTTLMDTIMDAVASGNKVTLVGFGTFEAAERKEREGRNPSSGEAITIPATTVPKFKAGKEFKEKVANHA